MFSLSKKNKTLEKPKAIPGVSVEALTP